MNAILDFALPIAQIVEKTSQKGKNEKKNSTTQENASSIKPNNAVQHSEKQVTWENIAAQKGKNALIKQSLAYPLQVA